MRKQTHPLRIQTISFKRLLLLSLFSLFAVLSVQAQQPTKDKPDEAAGSSSFLEVRVSAMPYEAVGKPKYYRMQGLGLPFISLHYGYRLSERATVQVGLGYGFNEMSGGGTARIISIDSIYFEQHFQRITAISVPFMIAYTPFNPNRRFQIYGNLSLAPVYRRITARASQSLQGKYENMELYNDESSSFTLVAMAGVTANYRLSKRLSVLADCSLSYFNFEYQNPQSFRNNSKGIGLNYRL